MILDVYTVIAINQDGQHNQTTKVHRRYRLSQFDHLELMRQGVPLLVNKTLTVCVVVREPFVIYNEPDESAKSTISNEEAQADLKNYNGVAIEVVKRLAAIFKFNIRVTRPKDGQFGILLPDKSWNGLVGTLVRNESDIGLTALSITVNRTQVVDFTRPYYVETAAILVRIPEEVQNYFAIFEPFSMTVWFILLASIVILILLITVMTKLEERQREQQKMLKLAEFLAHRMSKGDVGGNILVSGGRSHQNFVSHKSSSAHQRDSYNDEQFSKGLAHRMAAVSQAHQKQEFGSTWLERFYYATTCVLNILLIRGEYAQHKITVNSLMQHCMVCVKQTCCQLK